MDLLRSPICVCEGHVDHGKSSLLDKIRGTSIVKSEPGEITQAIGASIVPIEVIKRICGPLLASLKTELRIPGILFIDTPGHAAFAKLRKRGGNIADIAILVVDINEGFKPQTLEAIEIFRHSKTPFVVAANKIDLIPGWKPNEELLLKDMLLQTESAREKLDFKLYSLIGKFYELGFSAERFDRVDDYTTQLAIVPVSAKTGEGIPELLMVLTGLTQRYLEACLTCTVTGFAKGTVFEVKEEQGLGKTLNVIIYEGTLKKGDTIVIADLNKPVVTKVKALFQPAPLAEMRDKKSKFSPVQEVFAATGVKIVALDIDTVVAGMPMRSCADEDVLQVEQELALEINEVIIETDQEGIVIKADSLGSLEAMVNILNEKKIQIKKASIGNITKKDISEAESNLQRDDLHAVVLGFNVEIGQDAKEHAKTTAIRIFCNNVIYRVIEDFEKWLLQRTKEKEGEKLANLIRPCKMLLMPGYVFRQCNPAVVGMEILIGEVKAGTSLVKDEGVIAEIKSMQHEKESLSKAVKGQQVAVAMNGVTVGRQIAENDILYAAVPEGDFQRFKELKQYLKPEEIQVLKEYAEIMRKRNPMWGV